MVTLAPSQLAVEVQLSLAHHIQSLVKLERNRQIMCESGLLDTLLTHCQAMLDSTDDPLHLPVVRIFEKMASQAIDPYSLRYEGACALYPAVDAHETQTNAHLDAAINVCLTWCLAGGFCAWASRWCVLSRIHLVSWQTLLPRMVKHDLLKRPSSSSLFKKCLLLHLRTFLIFGCAIKTLEINWIKTHRSPWLLIWFFCVAFYNKGVTRM